LQDSAANYREPHEGLLSQKRATARRNGHQCSVSIFRQARAALDLPTRCRLVVGLLQRRDSDGWRWIVDGPRGDGRRYIVHSDELLSAFLELEETLL
jgi:hypothetical protein